jgi:sugar lactone lactonase YvrE
MMKTLKTNVLANGFSRLEAPRWHIGALWVSDTGAGKVYRVEINGRATVVADVPSRPFGLGFLPRGALLVASMRKKQILNFSGSKPAIHADMTGLAAGNLRDLAVARDGNTFVTCFDSEGSAPDCFKTAQVLLTTPAGETRVVAEDLAHPNGLAITSTHELLVAEKRRNLVLVRRSSHFRQSSNQYIAVRKAGLVENPCTQAIGGQVTSDFIWSSVVIASGEHIHNHASSRIQPVRN